MDNFLLNDKAMSQEKVVGQEEVGKRIIKVYSDRCFFLDLAKGVAIVLMLYGHCIQYCCAGSEVDFFENIVFKTIYSFHMPLFMLISGYLFYFSFQKRGLKELLIHRVQSLVQPIIFGGLFMFLVTDVPFALIKGKFGAIFTGGWFYEGSAIWFLWSVLAASVVVAIICKKISGTVRQLILLLLATIVVAFFPNSTVNIFMYPYFVLGFFFAKNKDNVPKWLYKSRYSSLILFPLMMCFYGKEHYIYTTGLYSNEYSLGQMLGIDLYRWLIGLVGSIFVLTILNIVYEKHICNAGRISKWLVKIGNKSLQIYVLSIPLLSTYLYIGLPFVLEVFGLENILVKNMFIYNFVITPLLTVAYSFGLYGVLKFLEKTKISKIMFGR